MPGSRSLIPHVLVYNYERDSAHWVLSSQATRGEIANMPWEIIEPDDVNRGAIEVLAGPCPKMYAEEVTVKPELPSTLNINPHDVR